MKALVNGRLILPDEIIDDGVVVFEDDTIVFSGEAGRAEIPRECRTIDASGNYIAPGFIDVHCHGGDGVRCNTDPVRMAEHHLRHGTTSLLCSIAYGISFEDLMAAVALVRGACEAETPGSIEGIHLEGPYISPNYGARSTGRGVYEVKEEEYRALIDQGGGLIRQWTFSPELDGLDRFVETVVRHGITPAMGHSDAGPEAVDKYYAMGARIATHLFDATGCSVKRTTHGGTRDPWFDECCMVHPGMYGELIPDASGAHVRPTMLKLALRTMGENRVVIITDASAERIGDDGLEININELGELSGSKMTMDRACRNMKRFTGADMRMISRMASVNPAKAIGVYDQVGSLEPGKRANILVFDEDFQLSSVFLKGSRYDRTT